MKEIKRIFLFIKKVESDKAKMERICAISEDEKHRFEFTLNQDDYDASVKEMEETFKHFCIGECGTGDNVYREVWSLDDEVLDGLDFEHNISAWLNQANWCCYECVEYNYKSKNAHLRNALPFDEFKAMHSYDESKEPLETKRLYGIYKREIDKTEFTEQEIENMVKFISDNKYSALFEAIGKNYPMRVKLCDTLCHLFMANKAEYEKQINGLTNALMDRIGVIIGRFAGIFGELPTTYHKLSDYND